MFLSINPLPPVSMTVRRDTAVRPDLNRNHINFSAIDRGASIDTREHVGYGIKYVLSGQELYTVDHTRHRVLDEQYLIINPGQQYNALIDACDTAFGACVTLAPQLIEQCWLMRRSSPLQMLDEPVSKTGPITLVNAVLPANSDGVSQLLRPSVQYFTRHRAVSDMNLFDSEHLFVSLAEIMVGTYQKQQDVLSRLPAQHSSVRQETYRRLMLGLAYLIDHWNEPYSLEETGKAAALSPYYFHRLFRMMNGISPYAYLLNYRIREACKLLAQGIEVQLVSQQVGFDNYDTFRKAFRRLTKKSPTAVRGLISF